MSFCLHRQQQDEVKSIVKKVTDSEYVLKRRQLEVSDFQTYLKYAINLDKLLTTRVKRLEANTKKVTKEVHDMLFAIQKTLDNHIIYIFDRSVRRFPAEVALWNDYIAFLQAKEAVAALNAVFGKALSLFPKNEDFWLQASIHELEANSNVHSARVTLQRALRANPASSKIWLRYFELELWNALRSSERQKALDIDADYEALQGAPMVVFTHALGAVQDIGSIIDIYAACETVGGDFSQKMQEILIAKYGHRHEVWQYLASSSVASLATKIGAEDAAAASSDGAKRKHSDVGADQGKATAAIELIADGMEKCVVILQQGSVHKAASVDSVTEGASSSASNNSCSASSQPSSSEEYTTMAVSCLHAVVAQAQQLLQEVDLSALNSADSNTSSAEAPGTASKKKKTRKGSASDEALEAASCGNSAAFNKLVASLKTVLAQVTAFSSTGTTSAKNAFLTHSNMSVAMAVQFEVYVLCSELVSRCSASASIITAVSALRDSSVVLNVRQLSAWVQESAPLLSKHIQKYYQNQLVSNQKNAECVRVVEGWCAPASALLNYIACDSAKVAQAETAELCTTLSSCVTFLVVAVAGNNLVKRLVELSYQNAQSVTTGEGCLRQVITATHALMSPGERSKWCVFYLQYLTSHAAAGTESGKCPLKILVDGYKWVDSVITSKPHLLHATHLEEFFQYVLDAAAECEVTQKCEVSKFVETVAEKAVACCPSVGAFWKALEELQQQRGDHKAATHTRWRRDKSVQGI